MKAMPISFHKNQCGFVLVEFMILAATIAMLTMIALAHFKHNEPARAAAEWKFASNERFQHAIYIHSETGS